MKKLLSILLAAVMLFSVSALGEAATYPLFPELTTYSVLNQQVASGGPWGDDMVFFKAMKDLTNMDFTFTNTPATDYQTKLNLSLASGELYDIYMSGVGADNVFTYGVQSGLFLDFGDMIEENMPNLMKLAETYPALLKVSRQADGGMYSFPKLLRTATSGLGIVYVNTDIMKAAGIEKEPETLDEFYEMCLAIKEYKKDDPEFIVLLSQTPDEFNEHFEQFIIAACGDYVNGYFNDDGTGKVFFNGITEQYYRYLEFANKLYKAGIINPDLYSMDAATALALLQEGKAAVTTAGTRLPIEDHGDGTYSVSVLGPLTSEWATEKKIASANIISDSYVTISAKAKNPEAILRWYDIFYSLEDVAPGLNYVSPWMGIRGETWDYIDETKEFYHRPQPLAPDMNASIYIQTYGAPQTYLGLDMTAIQQGGSLGNTVKGLGTVSKVYPYTVEQFPLNRNAANKEVNLLKFTEEEQEVYTNTMVDINAYIDQMKAKFITGVEPLENYGEYCKTLEKMGLSDVIEVVQAAYDRYQK